MPTKKNSFVVVETVFRPGKDIYRYYRNTAEQAVERVVTLYNEYRKEIKTASGRLPPVLSNAHIERMKKELKATRATSLASPAKWNQQYTWTIHHI